MKVFEIITATIAILMFLAAFAAIATIAFSIIVALFCAPWIILWILIVAFILVKI